MLLTSASCLVTLMARFAASSAARVSSGALLVSLGSCLGGLVQEHLDDEVLVQIGTTLLGSFSLVEQAKNLCDLLLLGRLLDWLLDSPDHLGGDKGLLLLEECFVLLGQLGVLVDLREELHRDVVHLESKLVNPGSFSSLKEAENAEIATYLVLESLVVLSQQLHALSELLELGLLL